MTCEACEEYARRNEPEFPVSTSVESSVESLLGRTTWSVYKSRPLFVDVAWAGCSGCSNLELVAALTDPQLQINTIEAKVAWKRSGDEDSPTTPEFNLFQELTRGHYQSLGSGRLVENYPVPPWDRPHFPQFFFIDPRRIDFARLNELCSLNASGDLFNLTGEVNMHNAKVFEAVQRTFQEGAIMLQMLNENLFSRPNEDFQRTAFFETLRCVLEEYHRRPETCLRYERPLTECRGEHQPEVVDDSVPVAPASV